MSRSLSSFLAILASCGSLAAAETLVPLTDETGCYTLHAVWLEGGMGSGIDNGDVADADLDGATFNQSLDGDWQPGLHAGLEWSRSRMDFDGEGWTLGIAVWYDQAPGRITAASSPAGPMTVDEEVLVEVLSVAVIPSWSYRFDSGSLLNVATRDWQLDIGPVLACGASRAQVGDGEQSAPGFAWQAGGRLRLHTEIASGLRVGFQVGALWLEARSAWDNTGEAVFRGFSPIAGLALGYEF